MEAILLILGLVLLATPIMAISSLVKISNLRFRVDELEEKLKKLESTSIDAKQVQPKEQHVFQQAQQELTDAQSTPVESANIGDELEVPIAVGENQLATPHMLIESLMSRQFIEGEDQAQPEIGSEVPLDAESLVVFSEQEEPISIVVEESVEAPVEVPDVQPLQLHQTDGRSVVPKSPALISKQSAKPTWVDFAVNAVKRWFTTGNVPVKVGILVLFAGVAALLKYVTDQGWVIMPMEVRLSGIAALALGALLFAWRKREEQRIFSLSVQGGAMGILLLTVFAAFKLYPMLTSPVAFGLTVALVGCTGLLAVTQNARILAVFAIFAGFLAPVWLSTDRGSHVALFSYYAILNAAILGMAWWRSWRMLNLLGFAFTFGIGTLWGVLKYVPAQFASTEPFLLLFFAFYLVIPILYARNFAGRKRDMVDAALVFGTPLVAFSLQAALIESSSVLAANALGLGILYGVLAKMFYLKDRYKELVPAYIALAAGFVTLAVPLAFSAQQTSCIYALEGAALIWWGLRQSRLISQWSGLGLQALGVGAFFYSISRGSYWSVNAGVVNPIFISMLMFAGVGLFCAWCYRSNEQGRLGEVQEDSLSKATAFYGWGLAWWVAAGCREISLFVPWEVQADAGIMLAVFTGWVAAEIYRRRNALLLAATTAGAMVWAVCLCGMQGAQHGYPLQEWGWLAWGVYAVLGARSIVCLRQGSLAEVLIAKGAQFFWWPSWALILSLSMTGWLDRSVLDPAWYYAAVALPWLVLVAGSLWYWRGVRLPLGGLFDVWRDYWQAFLLGVCGVWWMFALILPAGSAPWPWLPVFNPVEFLQLGFVGMAWYWLRKQGTQKFFAPAQQMDLFALAGFALISVMTLRMVHHWGDVPWQSILLSRLGQTWLSMVWSVLGSVLVWRGVRGNDRLVQAGGVVVQLLAGGAFGLSMLHVTGGATRAMMNFTFINMLLLALTGLWSAWCYFKTTHDTSESGYTLRNASAFYVWGLSWWCTMGLHEVYAFVPYLYQASVVLVFVMFTGWLAAEVYRKNSCFHKETPALLLGATTAIAIGLGVVLALVQTSEHGSPFTDYGWLAWICYAVLGWRSIVCLRSDVVQVADVAQFIWWPTWAVTLGLALSAWCTQTLNLGAGWYSAALALPWMGLVVASVWRQDWVRMPLGARLGARLERWHDVLQYLLFAVGAVWWVYALTLPSASAPLPWLPVLNPIDALQLVFLGTALYVLCQNKARITLPMAIQVVILSLVVFVLSSVMTLRGVHHWGGIAWDASLITSKLAQTCLSVVWSVLGVVAWIRGSRRGWRELWWAGAALMVVVLIKLLVVDRENLGNELGIISFIAYGVLCVVVGYFAPAPPRGVMQVDDKEQEDVPNN